MIDLPPAGRLHDIPAPAPQQDGVADEQAVEEAAFLQERGNAPDLLEARRLYDLDVIAIRRAFMAGIRRVASLLPLLGLLTICVWLWHLLTPWRWQTAEEVNHLQALLFSGAISALATAIATKKI